MGTSQEIKRFIEAMRMKEIKAKVRDEMDDAKSKIQVDNARSVLSGERCQIRIRL
jgi:hypothetical protein